MLRPPKWIRDDLFFVVLVVLAVTKAACARYFALGEVNPLSSLLLETTFIVIVLAIVDLVPSRRRYLLTLGAYSALSLMLLAMTVYVAYYAQLFDPQILSVAGQLATVGGAVGGLIKPAYAVFLIDIPLLAWWAVVLGRDDRALVAEARPSAEPEKLRRSDRHERALGRSAWVAIALAVCVVAFAAQMVSALQISDDVDGVAIAKLRGLVVAQLAVFMPHDAGGTAQADSLNPQLAPAFTGAPTVTPSTGSAPATVPVTPGSTLQARIEQIRGAEGGSRIATFSVGAYEGRNVIVVQVEALNTMVMQKRIRGAEITPNLNALIDESWYFPNTYAETGLGNTADAEFTVNTSLYPPRTQAAPVAYANRELPGLPQLLREEGYDTFTMHANTALYWNRKELYPSLGFSRYYDKDFFGTKDLLNVNGTSDEVFFQKAGQVLRKVEATETPYYAQLITLSAHTPFDLVPPDRQPVKMSPDIRGSLMGNYIASESYGDYAIGKFVRQLKADGIWDDSIVIFYGDHTAMNENSLSGADALGAKQLLGRAYSAADRQRVPLIIHLPGQNRAQVVTSTVGQVDIMPTIADLLGMDLRGVPHMGRSVFVDSNALVPMRSYLPGGTFANDTTIFLPGVGYDDGKAFSVQTGGRVDKTERERTDLARARQLSKMSEEWVLSLPKRAGARKLNEYWIPNHEARPATKNGGK